MARVNVIKQIKVDGKWVLRSIPKKPSGHYDWTVLPEGTYFIEWRENGQRKREPAGITASQAIEAQRKRRHELAYLSQFEGCAATKPLFFSQGILKVCPTNGASGRADSRRGPGFWVGAEQAD